MYQPRAALSNMKMLLGQTCLPSNVVVGGVSAQNGLENFVQSNDIYGIILVYPDLTGGWVLENVCGYI